MTKEQLEVLRARYTDAGALDATDPVLRNAAMQEIEIGHIATPQPARAHGWRESMALQIQPRPSAGQAHHIFRGLNQFL